MQIGNNQTQNYVYNQNVNLANKNDSSNSFNNYLEKEDLKNIKIINKNLISILEKNNAFSSLSKEEETLFRYVLEDDKISNDEIKNLTYEQMNKLNNIVNSVSQQVGGVALVNGIETFSMSNITNNNDFNKALFDTLKTIENDTYKLVFSLDLGGKLGYNNTSFNKVDIEQLKALEKEKYKDFENPERLMADYNNWQINDYEGFIKNLKNEYKLLSEDTIISSESRVLYKRYSQYMSDLETNYNKVINEPKYA